MILPSQPDPPPVPPADETEPRIAAPAESGGTAAPALTPEEQMAMFEEELKENDWGHQPC